MPAIAEYQLIVEVFIAGESLEVGKLADIALWRMDDLAHAGISDPVAALVFGPAPRVELLLVGGDPVVRESELRTADEAGISREIAVASRRLAESAEVLL